MKMVRDTTGRFGQRPHYEPAELDRECESLIASFLKKKHGRVEYPVSTDDLSSLVEQEAQDLDLYADLSEYGESVEGVTIFRPGAHPMVKISRNLSEADARRNRLRTTITHEYGHVHFHGYLFDEKLKSSQLFTSSAIAKPTKTDVQVCKRETMLDASHSDWMEWQAGHVCGAILMPAGVLTRFVKETTATAGDTTLPALEALLVSAVTVHFQVSAEAARVRLRRLGFLAAAPQNRVLFE